MSRTCTVCAHPAREAIDRALVGGAPYRRIAKQFAASAPAVLRHKAEHLPAVMVKAQEAEGVAHALDVVKQLRAINGVSMEILTAARKSKDPDTALKAIDRIQRQIELQAKLLGQLDERPQVNVLVMPEWVQVRAVILTALGPFPEARVAVASQLAVLDAPGEGIS